MAGTHHYLALDQGSHASKALIFDGDGRVVAAAETPIETRFPQPGWVEHDPEEIIRSIEQAIAEACAASGAGPLELRAAGLATQRSSVVCWDRVTGEALSPVLSWQDRRNAAWLEAQAFDADRLRALTGLVASPHYGASKLRWCFDHLAAVRQAGAEGRLCCGPLASFVVHRLLAERPLVVDPANAARTLLWDLHTGDWSDELLGACGILRQNLPRCVPSRDEYGTLRVGGRPVPLNIVTGDQSAALFAWGEPDSETLFVNIGTGAFVQRLFPEQPPSVPGMLQGVAWRDSARTVGVLEGTVNGAGAALEWLARERGAEPRSLVEKIDGWLEAQSEPPLFVNGVGGLGSPYWRADCPIRFSAPADLSSETVAVLESIVFLLQVNIDTLGAAASGLHAAPATIVVSGGLARFDGLCQRIADLSRIPVERPAAIEATSQGVAWLLSGVVADAPPPSRFCPRRAGNLRTRYEKWQSLMG
jgi:glycerol kinase